MSASYSFCQPQAAKDSSVDILPHWKTGETHTVKIKATTTDVAGGKGQTFLSTFAANFKVQAYDTSGYKIEWVYTGATLGENDPVLENQIVGHLLNTKMVFRLTDVGRFVELVNVEEVKTAANKAVDDLITSSAANPTMNVQYKAAKQLIATKQGLEIALLKQIKFYNFSFGFNYKLHFTQTNPLKYPNPLGGQPFDAVEKVELTKLDAKNNVCVIETSKTIDGDVLKKSVMEYIKKISNADAKEIDAQLGRASLEMSEATMQQLDYKKSTLQKSYYKRTMNLGFQSRVTLLEMETAD